MDGVLKIQELFTLLLNNLLLFWDLLNTPLGDLLDDAPSWIVQILLSVLEKNDYVNEYFLSTSLFSIILLSSIIVFVVFTLVKWLIDILP